MKHKLLIASATFGSVMVAGVGAYSAPVFIGLQEAGVNGGAITQEATGNGSASITNAFYGNSINGFFELSVSATGGPPALAEPDLFSNSVSATATHPGTISVYVSLINQVPNNFAGFKSIFNVSALGTGVSVVESTFIHECAVPNNACLVPSDVFDTTTLLSKQTFSGTGSVTDFSSNGIPIATSPYAITEEYTITFTQTNTSTTDSIRESVPEPGILMSFGVGLLGLGVIRRRTA